LVNTICAEATSLSDYSFRHSLQNTSLIGTDDDSAPVSEENFSGVSGTRLQSTEADNGLLIISNEVPDDVANQQREPHGSQLEDGTIHSMESIPAGPGAEISAAISGGPVVPPHGNDDPLSCGEEETGDALQGGEVSGKSFSIVFCILDLICPCV